MAEITRLSGCSEWIELDFVDRERTPSVLMKLGIRLHFAGLSLSNTILELEKFGVERPRKAVHDWVQKVGLQPASDASPDHVTFDETVIRINGQQFWLYAAVDPERNEFLHLRRFTTTTTSLTQQFLRELREKHNVEDAMFLVDHAQHLASALQRQGSDFRLFSMEIGMLSNVSLKRYSGKLPRLEIFFIYVDPETAETWLRAFAVWWNSLNQARWIS